MSQTLKNPKQVYIKKDVSKNNVTIMRDIVEVESNKKSIITKTTTKLIQIKRYAKLLDAIPGFPIKIGIDGIIGLFPILGDLLTALLSFIIIIMALNMGAPMSLIFRMGFNIFIDFIFGSIPILGDIFDIFYKANLKNYKLLEKWTEKNFKTST